ncbi:MAG: hypothetical protein ACI902_003206 [Psychroserpens sp.]
MSDSLASLFAINSGRHFSYFIKPVIRSLRASVNRIDFGLMQCLLIAFCWACSEI